LLKYNACAFQGQTVITPNGTIAANQFWVGSANPTNGDIRGTGRVNVDLSLRRSFVIREQLKLEVAADATNFFNHTQYNGSFVGGLGNTNLTNNPTGGLIPGYGTSSTFGTLPIGTFDPRQITMRMRIVF
jgi:hypothetical protein